MTETRGRLLWHPSDDKQTLGWTSKRAQWSVTEAETGCLSATVGVRDAICVYRDELMDAASRTPS